MAGRKERASGARRPENTSHQTTTRKTSGATLKGDISSRAVIALIFFFFIAILLGLRLVYLQTIVSDEYSTQAKLARTVDIETSPRRGTIYDRNGAVLAKSVDATTIYANPYEVSKVKEEAAQIASVLGGDAADYEERLSTGDTSFVYLKRKADVEAAQELKDLALEGIYFLSDTKRVYPNGKTGGQVIGFVDVDGKGISGLELQYNDILRGTAGTLVVERGAKGIPIPGGVHQDIPAVDGQDIIISLDLGMQEYMEERLSRGVSDIGGKGGNSVIMDAATGEIFACASLPYFNPSDTSEVEEGATQLRSITDAFEPGSIFKAVSVNAILEKGVMAPDDTLYCPSYISADGYAVSDAHDRAGQTMTLRQILDRSSNVGMSLATEKLGFEELYRKIVAYNLTKKTGVDYPGETNGYLLEGDQWSRIQSYNVSFGQGVSLTPLQMVRYYGALLKEGEECVPHFLMKKLNSEDQPTYPTETVISNKESISTLTSMLETVVTEGTATDAAIEGYSVAGKTGTAEIAKLEGGYYAGLYNISFVGFLPHSSSQLVCFVGATEVPGDRKVTTVFKDIMTSAIDRYRIVPSEG